MIRIIRVRKKIAGLGRDVYSTCRPYKTEFKTVEEAREYYENLYNGIILFDYETVE